MNCSRPRGEKWPSYAQDAEARVLSGLSSLHSLALSPSRWLSWLEQSQYWGLWWGGGGGWMCVEGVVLEFLAGVQVPALMRSVPGEESDPAPAFKELPV